MSDLKLDINIKDLRDQCLESYALFCELMQDDTWFDEVHKLLCCWVQRDILEAEKRLADDPNEIFDIKLQVTMPRGSLKSTIITKYLPVWLTLRQYYLFGNQGMRSLIVTNTFTNAKKKLRDIRGLFDSHDLFKRLFSETLPKKVNRWTDEGAEINRDVSFPESTFECAGTGTKLTGRHFNLILEDDTTAPDEDEMKVSLTTPSRDTIEKAIGFHKASTPLYVPKGFRMSFIVTTRWAEEDLVDYVRKNEKYKYFDMPAVDSTGKPNFSMFYSVEALEEIKNRVGPYMFSCLYLNTPLDASLRVFSEDTFKWINSSDVPNKGKISIAIDPAASERDEACETSITIIQHVEEDNRQYQYWWEDINGHFSFADQVTKTIDKAIFYEDNVAPVEGIIVETIAYQAALEYMLEQEMIKRNRFFALIPFRSRQHKDVRIEGMQPMFFSGRVFFVKNSISQQVPSQLKQFPNGKLVDTIDCFSMHRALYEYDPRRKEIRTEDELERDSFMAIVEENRRKRGRRSSTGMPTGLDTYHDDRVVASFDGMSTGLSYTVTSGGW